jgi:hypothetical protein
MGKGRPAVVSHYAITLLQAGYSQATLQQGNREHFGVGEQRGVMW